MASRMQAEYLAMASKRPKDQPEVPARAKPMRVEDVMVRSLVTVAHDATLATAWRLMRTRQVRHLPVLDADRRLAGIVTDHDLRQVILDPSLQEEPGKLAGALDRLRVNEIMTWGVVTVQAGTELREAARIMYERKLGALPVTAAGRAVGMLTASDVIEALLSGAAG
jgi:acetoin utilization protein AcuB